MLCRRTSSFKRALFNALSLKEKVLLKQNVQENEKKTTTSDLEKQLENINRMGELREKISNSENAYEIAEMQKQLEQLENDPWDFEEFLGVLEKIYGFTDQDEKDWIYGAFLENWKILTCDFEDLTE